jgi:hypothetical protein
LRANGSRECAPDDGLHEAIHRALDCIVASFLTMTMEQIPLSPVGALWMSAMLP